MADAIYALITYPEMHTYLKEKGLEEVNNITWETAGLKVRAIYDQVIR